MIHQISFISFLHQWRRPMDRMNLHLTSQLRDPKRGLRKPTQNLLPQCTLRQNDNKEPKTGTSNMTKGHKVQWQEPTAPSQFG